MNTFSTGQFFTNRQFNESSANYIQGRASFILYDCLIVYLFSRFVGVAAEEPNVRFYKNKVGVLQKVMHNTS